MSNAITQQLLSVACPHCGAGVGKVCSQTGTFGSANLYFHPARWRARPPSKVIHLGYSKQHNYDLGVTPSTKCAHGTHAPRCSGKLAPAHGITPKCSCQCHHH
jgi:hypothetical protein